MTWLYGWLGVTALALILEFATSEMISIWFVAGGFVAMILSAFNLGWYITIPAFIVVSAVSMACFRKLVMKKLNKGDSKLNADSAFDKEVYLLEDLYFGHPGSIKVNDVVWTAIAEDEKAEIKKGTIVKIKKLKGNKYIIEKIKNN